MAIDFGSLANDKFPIKEMALVRNRMANVTGQEEGNHRLAKLRAAM